MRKIILLMCVLCSLSMYSQKIGYLYSDSIMSAIPEYKIETSKLDSLKQSYSKEIVAKQTALQLQYNKITKPYTPKENETLQMIKKRMSAVDTLSLSMLEDEAVQVQKKKTSYDRILQTTYAQNIQPILDRVSATISKYAIQNNLTAVYSMEQLKTMLIYIDPKQNITGSIIQRLKSNFK